MAREVSMNDFRFFNFARTCCNVLTRMWVVRRIVVTHLELGQ